VLNLACSLRVELEWVSAGETSVTEISFCFGLFKLLTVGNGAFSIDFNKWRFTIFTSTVLINAAWLFDSDDLLVIIIVLLDQISTCDFASVV
jgi:hypothetical protein